MTKKIVASFLDENLIRRDKILNVLNEVIPNPELNITDHAYLTDDIVHLSSGDENRWIFAKNVVAVVISEDPGLTL